MTRLLLLLLLLMLQPVVLALEVAVADVTSRKLLTDRAWFSQVAQVPRHVSDDSVACVAVSDPLRPGLTVEGYELVERSGLLGVCKHQQTQQTQWPMQTRDKMEVVPWSTMTSDQDTDRTHSAPVCPLPGAATASLAQRVPAPPLPPPESTGGEEGFGDHSSRQGPVLEYQYVTEESERIYVNAHYRLKKKFDAGSHGEVWRATRRHESNGREEHFVLKRLFLELGESMAQMGLREAHFGALLHGERHVARFVEYFFRPSRMVESEEERSHPRTTPELWLVFYDEGKSLRQYLYEKLEVVYGAGGQGDTGAGVVLQPSRFWEKLRTDARGENVLREIVRQLLQALAALHARGITHRDIKPSNILVSIPPSSSASATPPMPLVKLADFGSAVDDYTLHNLYAASGGNDASASSGGPSQAEETREYQPPEVLFSDNGQPYDYSAPEAYDLWSVGVVFLEMVLGSPQVFLISPRERAKLDVVLDAQQRRHRHRRGKHDSEEAAKSGWRTKAYLLHVLTQEFCIFQPAPRQLRSLWDKYALHPSVGIALFQGRKKYMEDFVLVLTEQQLHERRGVEAEGYVTQASEALGFDLYAVVDGHLGSAAATFVVNNLPRVLCRHFAAIPKTKEYSSEPDADQAVGVSAERGLAEKFALRQTFLEMHESFLQSLDDMESIDELELETNADTYTNGTAAIGEYFSGCTLTVVLHFRREKRVVSANVGDSRALAWMPDASELESEGRQDEVAANVVPLSMDHWPNDPNERSRIESSGGFVNFSGLWRVVGQLAVSRSLGDRHLRKYVTAEPSVFHSVLGERSSVTDCGKP
uniref:Protein kinase domain-containing protein n=1 Tax=Phytophthora ramorum TaxID=164328 RepID=H3GCR3_PHYRM